MPSGLTHRECLRRVLRGEPTPWVPNYELGCWGQTVERWYREGMPHAESRVGAMDMFEGEPHFRLDRRAFARIATGMIPDFGYEVLEETEEYLVARHGNGIVTRALKPGTVRGTRMCMDTYLSFPVTDRRSWNDVKRRYDPRAPVRYPFWWDEQVRLWRERDYPVVLLGNASFGLYSQLRSWVGTEGISYMFYDDPALVEEMVEFAADFLLELVEPALGQVEFDYFNFFEDCAGSTSSRRKSRQTGNRQGTGGDREGTALQDPAADRAGRVHPAPRSHLPAGYLLSRRVILHGSQTQTHRPRGARLRGGSLLPGRAGRLGAGGASAFRASAPGGPLRGEPEQSAGRPVLSRISESKMPGSARRAHAAPCDRSRGGPTATSPPSS